MAKISSQNKALEYSKRFIVQSQCLFVALVSVYCLFSACVAYADTQIPELPFTVVDPNVEHQALKFQYYIDSTNELDVRNIHNDQTLAWETPNQELHDLGYEPNNVWYRLRLDNQQAQAINSLIEIDFAILDFVDFYQFKHDELLETYRTGDRVPYYERPVDHPNFIFPVTLAAGETQTLYLRIQTSGAHIVPLNVWLPEALVIHLGKQDAWTGAYLGGCFIVVLFFLLASIGLKESVYLYYSLTIATLTLFTLLSLGILYPWFPNSPDFMHSLYVPLMTGGTILAALFTRQFLYLDTYSKGLVYLISSMIAVMLVCAVASLFIDFRDWLKVVVIGILYTSFCFAIIGPIAIYKGSPNGWVYTIATVAYAASMVANTLNRNGLIDANFFTEYGGVVTSAFEGLVFTAALAWRVYREHENKVSAQSAQLEASDERIKTERQLLIKSMTDASTLLPNRTAFEQQIRNSLIYDQGKRIAVVLVDVQRYSEISKTLGHQNTDLLLREIAQHYNTLLAKMPGVMKIGNVGRGDDLGASDLTTDYVSTNHQASNHLSTIESSTFGLLMDADVAIQHMEDVDQILHSLREPVEFKGMQLELNVAVGAAIYPEHGVDTTTLMRHANVALDSDEAHIKPLVYFNPEQDQYNARRLTMVSDLKQAIRDGKLELFLQPQYDLHQDKVIGAEALIRWHHELYGTIRPDEFIPLAEQTGIIKPLTRWVFRQALQQQSALKSKGYDLNISVNLSAANLGEGDLVEFLASELDSQQADPGKIYLELTETAMMQHPQAAIATLHEIRNLGLQVSIDDFGAGYSSLAYLSNLPANEIKIDRALVSELDKGEGEDTVVQSTIDMCHKLGFTLVAEGVETISMLKELAHLNCDVVQGYLLTPPLPQAQFINWLENDHSDRFAC